MSEPITFFTILSVLCPTQTHQCSMCDTNTLSIILGVLCPTHTLSIILSSPCLTQAHSSSRYVPCLKQAFFPTLHSMSETKAVSHCALCLKLNTLPSSQRVPCLKHSSSSCVPCLQQTLFTTHILSSSVSDTKHFLIIILCAMCKTHSSSTCVSCLKQTHCS